MDLFSITDIACRFDAISWTGVCLRSDRLPELAATSLLHAGPPLGQDIPHAIRNSAAQALCYEGLARSVPEAYMLLESGHIELLAAQDFGIVTPLTQVVSANMPMAVLQCPTATRLAPLIEAGVPALRFGNAPPDSPARLHMMAVFAQQVLAPALAAAPVAIAPLVQASLAQGQECHALTTAANTALVEALPLSRADQSVLLAYPAFVLPILMAACSLYLSISGGDIIAAAGNGRQFGIKRRGKTAWTVVDATAPQGLLAAGSAAPAALGAVGDSAVVDFAGLGGQALMFCPALAQEYAPYLPADLQAHRRAVLDPHNGNVGGAQVLASAQSPLVNLAILGREQAAGMIGRGVYSVPTQALI